MPLFHSHLVSAASQLILIILLAAFLFLSHSSLLADSTKSTFPDLRTKPLLDADAVSIIATVPSIPGGIDLTDDGRLFFSFHPFAPYKVKVAELNKSKNEFKSIPDENKANDIITSVLSVRVNHARGKLLYLDHANFAQDKNKPAAIHVIDLKSNQYEESYYFPESIVGSGSMLNDFVVSTEGRFLYISDCGIVNNHPAIVVVDMQSIDEGSTSKWKSWRALDAHESTLAKDAIPFMNDEFPLNLPWKVGVDSIALVGNHTLYFAAIYDKYLWKIPTEQLQEEKLDHTKYVSVAGPKTISDGIVASTDEKYIFVTDFEHSEISMIEIDGWKVKSLVQNKKLLRWPDGIAYHNNILYVTCSDLTHAGSPEELKQAAPFHIVTISLKDMESRDEL